MRSLIRRTLSELRGCSSGNTTLLVALGMPMLIGGAGLGVDLAQWYMWKRELQYAVDQAAIAGAYARLETATESTYVTRANQEFESNLSVIENMTAVPSVELANYAGGTDNSVAVSATATRALPFSTMLTGASPNIYAYAQATFAEGETFTSCLIATDDDAEGAITIGGSSVLTASCGLAALSTNENAITVNGNPEVDAGWILAGGGIDDWFDENTDDVIMENMDGLVDPFEGLTPPNPTESQVPRTYSCASSAGTTTATVTTNVSLSYSYFRGPNANNASAYTYSNPKPPSSSSNTVANQQVAAGTVAGSTSNTAVNNTLIGGSGQNKIYERKTTVTTITRSNLATTGAVIAGSVVPGTYSNIHVSCDTTFATGVYIIDGGQLIINGNYQVTGTSVMFVLKNGAGITFNGGASINLTGITAYDLETRGVTPQIAERMADMLVFEDRSSGGGSQRINGNASTILNGTMYFPVSTVDFSGTAGVTSRCLMIAAAMINITGNTDMSTFCPPDSELDDVVATTQGGVKLVA